MPQLRQDVLTGEWVIFATNRSKRPYDFVKTSEAKRDTQLNCPFCPQNKDQTPEELFSDERFGIRVFNNKYPALDRENAEIFADDAQSSVLGVGEHEVIVDTDKHFLKPRDFSVEHNAALFKVLQNRYVNMKSKDDIKYIQIFKNNGAEAGMSLRHSHWQILGLPIVNRLQKDIGANSAKYREKFGVCPMRAICENEKTSERLIDEEGDFIAFAPYASKLSYEVCIAPLKPVSAFDEFAQSDFIALAKLFKRTLTRLRAIAEDISFNVCFMDAPKGEDKRNYHWHMRILPRTGNFAGYEFATGSYINPVLPETAAKLMKNFKI